MIRRQNTPSIQAAFSRLIRSKVMDDVATPLPPPKTSYLCCLLVQVRDDTPDDLQRNVEQTIPICLENHGFIGDMMASIELIAFGTHGGTSEESQHNSRTTREKLLSSLGNQIRIVSFSGDITYGIIGKDARFNYSLLVPRFDRFLGVLLDTQFGHITELSSWPA